MNEKQRLCLKRIRICDFVLYELALFLDTHPKCCEALELFNKYNEMRCNAVEEYTKHFGPLVMKDSDSTQKWCWINGPWPWEREAN